MHEKYANNKLTYILSSLISIILITTLIIILFYHRREGYNWKLYDYKFHPSSLKIDNTWANYYNSLRSYDEDGKYTSLLTQRF